MKLIQGHFNGTGADVYLCLGSIPYSIKFWNLEAATPVTTEWNRAMIHDILTCEGITRPADGSAVLDHTFGEGISLYYGGDLMTTSNQTSVTYGEGVYLERDDADYRYFTNSAAGIVGDASTDDIVDWTLDTAATPTGHFNGDVVGAYIGEGSLIRIKSTDNKHVYEACITELTAGQGVAANEVTLSWAVPSGKVEYIGGKYGYKPVAIGKVSKPGVLINYATLNVNDAMIAFEAVCP
jgi:hypothetical protein